MKLLSDAQPLMLNYLENADVNQTVHVAFSRRGDLLASTGWDGATRLLDPVHGRRCCGPRALRRTLAATTADWPAASSDRP